jgi:hypothetical protein
VTKDEGTRFRACDRASGRADARYANCFQIGHNAFEFLLEFGQRDARTHTRMYLSPQHARMLSDLLLQALREYESAFGPMPRARHESRRVRPDA